jgi:hypothetical protein
MIEITSKISHLKNITKLLLAYIVTSIVYGYIYYNIRGHDNFTGLNFQSTFIDCLYFSFTTTSTVGYGDISPKSQLSRIIVITHQLVILSEIVYIFK